MEEPKTQLHDGRTNAPQQQQQSKNPGPLPFPTIVRVGFLAGTQDQEGTEFSERFYFLVQTWSEIKDLMSLVNSPAPFMRMYIHSIIPADNKIKSYDLQTVKRFFDTLLGAKKA